MHRKTEQNKANNRLEIVTKELEELKEKFESKLNELRVLYGIIDYIKRSGTRAWLKETGEPCPYSSTEEALLDYELKQKAAIALRDQINIKERELTLVDPDKKGTIYLNQKEPISLLNDNLSDEWTSFLYLLLPAVTNMKKGKYPVARLNEDNSISLLFHRCDTQGCNECKDVKRFEDLVKKEYILDQLNFHRQNLGLQLTADKKEFLENKGYNETIELAEYRLNISPQHLDTILKLNKEYSGYKYQYGASLLNLVDETKIKPGYILLFPVYPLENNRYLLRVAGCQFTELLSLQLLHLLPNFAGNETGFHWSNAEVDEVLSIDRSCLEQIMNSIMLDSKMFAETDGFTIKDTKGNITKHFYLHAQSQEGLTEISGPSTNQDSVKIVDIDKDANYIYARYGNCGSVELESCQSLEIRTLDFLNYVKNLVVERLKYRSTDKYYADKPEKIEQVKNSLVVIDKMIEIEKERLNEIVKAGENKSSFFTTKTETQKDEVMPTQTKQINPDKM